MIETRQKKYNPPPTCPNGIELDRIFNLNFIELISEILSFYTCPDECNASCCKKFDIFYNSEEIKKISNSNKKYKSILKNLVDNPNPTTIKGIQSKDKMYPTKPCPFLNNDTSKCKIQKIKPICCKSYPFGLKEDLDKSHPSYPVMITLDRCLLGTDILTDFMIYNHTLSQVDSRVESDVEDFLEMFMKEALIDKTNVTELYSSQFFDITIFRGFLFFLETSYDQIRIEREKIKQLILIAKLSEGLP